METPVYEEKIFEQEYTPTEDIGKVLKRNYLKEKNPMKRQELGLATLTYFLKRNNFETQEMEEIFKELVSLIRETEKKLYKNFKEKRNFSRKVILDIFYKTNIYKLFNIENLYREINIVTKADEIKALRKDLEKNDSFFEQEYKKYLSLLANDLFSKYGTSFWYLLIITFILIFFFGEVYYITDSLASGNTLVSPDGLKTLDYYLYASVSTISNLGGSVEMAGNLFLRIMFAIEQILGVILFGIFVIIAGRKL